MPRPIHFEITADDPARAGRFYAEVFGWKVSNWEGPVPYWLVTTGDSGPGIDGGIMARAPDLGGTVNTIGVPDLDAYVARVKRSGGAVTTPRTAVPGIGWFCYCKDSEGNAFGMMQEDPSAR
jgi:predicted enzyme related to lactoylglutathione lyase